MGTGSGAIMQKVDTFGTLTWSFASYLTKGWPKAIIDVVLIVDSLALF